MLKFLKNFINFSIFKQMVIKCGKIQIFTKKDFYKLKFRLNIMIGI